MIWFNLGQPRGIGQGQRGGGRAGNGKGGYEAKGAPHAEAGPLYVGLALRRVALHPQDQVHLGGLVGREAFPESGRKLGDHISIIPLGQRASKR